MAYENVNVTKLKNDLNKINDINSNKIDNLVNSLSRNEWKSIGQIRVSDALKEISKEIKKLKSDANNYKKAADYINKYKDEQTRLRTYKNKKEEYKRKLLNCPSNDQVNRQRYQSKINEYNSKINSSNSRLKNYQNQINSLAK